MLMYPLPAQSQIHIHIVDANDTPSPDEEDLEPIISVFINNASSSHCYQGSTEVLNCLHKTIGGSQLIFGYQKSCNWPKCTGKKTVSYTHHNHANVWRDLSKCQKTVTTT